MSVPETRADADREHDDRDVYRCPCCHETAYVPEDGRCHACPAVRCTGCGEIAEWDDRIEGERWSPAMQRYVDAQLPYCPVCAHEERWERETRSAR